MKNKLLLLVSALTLLLILTQVGCSGTKTTSPTTTNPPTSTTTTATTKPTTSTTTTSTTTTSSTSTTTTTTTSTTTSTTKPSAKVLGSVALPLVPTFHPAAYATVCMLCHAEGVGVQQYPMAPTWPGTPVSPGPWTVEKGSPADHTGRTDVATCTTQAGCHTMGK
jgi:hypothetical protein